MALAACWIHLVPFPEKVQKVQKVLSASQDLQRAKCVHAEGSNGSISEGSPAQGLRDKSKDSRGM